MLIFTALDGNPFVYFYSTKAKQSFAIALKQKETHASLNSQVTLFTSNNMTNKFSLYLSNLQNESAVVFPFALKAWVMVFLLWEEGSGWQDLMVLERLAQVLVR